MSVALRKVTDGCNAGALSSGDGQLYACGMFAWAGSQQQPGGFYRVRATGKPAYAPVGLETSPRQMRVLFSEPLDRESTVKAENWEIEAWDLKRTRNYGSRHYNQRRWQVAEVELSDDGRVVTLEVPDLVPTWGMSIRCKTKGIEGMPVVREIHNSVHNIGR